MPLLRNLISLDTKTGQYSSGTTFTLFLKPRISAVKSRCHPAHMKSLPPLDLAGWNSKVVIYRMHIVLNNVSSTFLINFTCIVDILKHGG